MDAGTVEGMKQNIKNLKTEIEEFQGRDYFEDKHTHQMPPPPRKE